MPRERPHYFERHVLGVLNPGRGKVGVVASVLPPSMAVAVVLAQPPE
jgi:hypothetical protein